MTRIHIYSPPLTMADDTRLIQLFLEAERNRWWNRINWYAVITLLALAAVDGLALYEMWRHFR